MVRCSSAVRALIKRAAAAEISPEMTEPDHCSQNRPRGQICSDLLALALPALVARLPYCGVSGAP